MAHFGKDLEDFNGSRHIHIKSAEQTDNFTVYVITVTVGSYSWTVKHRYSEFYDLHEKLTACYKLDKSLLPPKKLFGNQTESFVKKRQRELEIYLQTILLYLAQHVPSCLAYFLDFDQYEIHGITQAMAEDLYNRGESLLHSKDKYTVTSLQLYSLTERLKLPEPTCDSGDVKKDLGHILDFITRTKHLKVIGGTPPIGTSNIVMSKLPFDLTLFKSLQTLEVSGCNFHLISGMETVKQTLVQLHVYESPSSMQEMLLQDAPHWKAEDGSVLVGSWESLTYLDLGDNGLATIHPSIQLIPNVETLKLGNNEIEVIENLQWLSQLTYLDLSNNNIQRLDSLHTKLGNVKVFVMTNNQVESLHGFSKLFSLQTLDVSNNKISTIEEVHYISHLPCLEDILMEGNAVTNTLDYRTKTLELFGDRVREVVLDHEKPSQKELDTVAVLQALRKAKTTKVIKKVPRKAASAASLTDMYSHSPKSLSEHMDESQIAATGPVSHSVPASVMPWLVKDSASARSQSPFSQDSESSYNSALDSEVGLEAVPGAHPFHFVPSSLATTESAGYPSNTNNTPGHTLVPEAHPFDLSFENTRETATATSKPVKKLTNPLSTTGLHSSHSSVAMRKTRSRKSSKSSVGSSSSSGGQQKDSHSIQEEVQVHKEASDDSESLTTMKGGVPSATSLPQKRTWMSMYNAADLPSTSNTLYVRWLHEQLLPKGDNAISSSSEPSRGGLAGVVASPASPPSSILDIVWCYVRRMSHPDEFVPCCLILTSSTIFLEKLVDGDFSNFYRVPDLQPLVILSLKNIQQLVIGPCYSYLRLEEAFVGNSGTFSVFGLDPYSVRRLVNTITSSCRSMTPANELDMVDLNMHSDVLKTIISHEEKLPGMASDRLVLMIPIQAEEITSGRHNFLILSENQVYCVRLGCIQWPPPSFQTSTPDQFTLDIIHEYSILNNRIVDMKLHPSSGHDMVTDRENTSSSSPASIDGCVTFQEFRLSINVSSVSEKDWMVNISNAQGSNCISSFNYLFPSSAYRDLFLDRLSNLRAEHENRMLCPNVREEPEGGNEQLPTTLCQSGIVATQLPLPESTSSTFIPPPQSELYDSNVVGMSNINNSSSVNNSTSEETSTYHSPHSELSSYLQQQHDSNSTRGSSCVSPNHSDSNESFRSILTDSDVFKEPVEYPGPGPDSTFYSSSPKDDLSVSPMSNFSRASISPPLDALKPKPVPVQPAVEEEGGDALSAHNSGWHREQPMAKADSLPSSFDWKGFYFKSPLNPPDVIHENDPTTTTTTTVAAASGDGTSFQDENYLGRGNLVVVAAQQDSEAAQNSFNSRLFLDLKKAITKSGGSEDSAEKTSTSTTPIIERKPSVRTPVESELDVFLKQCVKSYDLIHSLPTKLKPLCLMNGSELRKFFYSTISQFSNQEGLQEELHYVVWSNVVPYTNPRQEITSLVMLSTYAVYLVSDTEIKVNQTSRPSWMSHSRNQSDSAITWKTETNDPPNSPKKKHVKPFAVLKYKDLHQINVGLFDQCVRLTGFNENSVFTMATRDSQVTEQFIQKLKQVLTLSVSSPMLDRSGNDLEQDFYHVKSQGSKSTLEGVVYTHPSKVNFIYPGDETVKDMLYLIKEKIASTTALSSIKASSISLWYYIQCYLLPLDDIVSSSTTKARSIVITPLYFAVAVEDLVTYPLPDFVRGLPENPWHEVVECRPIDCLKGIKLYQGNPHWMSLTFADEKPDIVVDVAMQHFGQPLAGRERQKLGPEVSYKLHVQSVKERDKLIQVLEKLWKQQVSVVGRILDVHTV